MHFNFLELFQNSLPLVSVFQGRVKPLGLKKPSLTCSFFLSCFFSDQETKNHGGLVTANLAQKYFSRDRLICFRVLNPSSFYNKLHITVNHNILLFNLHPKFFSLVNINAQKNKTDNIQAHLPCAFKEILSRENSRFQYC